MSASKQFPQLGGKTHPDVERAIRDAYLAIYDLQSATVAVNSKIPAAITPQTVQGAVNGTNKNFTVTNKPSTVMVFADGLLSTAYTYNAGTLIMTTAPTTSLVVFGT